MLLQARVPGLFHRHHPVAEGFFGPPQNLLRNQVETLEGVPQKVLFYSMLLTQDIQHKVQRRVLVVCLNQNDHANLWNPHLLRQREVVSCQSMVQERCSELQAEKDEDRLVLRVIHSLEREPDDVYAPTRVVSCVHYAEWSGWRIELLLLLVTGRALTFSSNNDI